MQISEFEPVNLDECVGSDDFYRQSRLMITIADDLRQQGQSELSGAFQMYGQYSLYRGHSERWNELGDKGQRHAWMIQADNTYEHMPKWAKWA